MAVGERIGAGPSGSVRGYGTRGGAAAGGPADLARQAANVAGALLQVGAAILSGPAVGQVSDENRSAIVPAGYAFAIWTPIFALAFAYAVYQALPSRRTDALLRRVGWWTAAAFVANGVWELLFPARQFVPAQALLVGIWAGAGAAYVGLVRHARRHELSGIERRLVAPLIGLLFGWVSAAAPVGALTTLVALGVVDGGPEALVGAALLLLCAGVAVAALRFGRSGPRTALLPFGAAVIWAFVAIVANQHEASPLAAGTAALAAAIVAGALVATLAGGAPDRPTAPRG